MVYVCEVCGWLYDEDAGCPEMDITPGTKFDDLPDDFFCPLCHVGKDMFPLKNRGEVYGKCSKGQIKRNEDLISSFLFCI